MGNKPGTALKNANARKIRELEKAVAEMKKGKNR